MGVKKLPEARKRVNLENGMGRERDVAGGRASVEAASVEVRGVKEGAEVSDFRDIRVEEWVEEPVRKRKYYVSFHLRMEEELYLRLKRFVNTKAKRWESMTYIINRALEKYLDELEKRPG